MSRKKKKLCNRLTDEQIYSIPADRRIHEECKQCRCTMCAWWRTDCMTCAVCLFEARPFTKCPNFEPYILGTEPYKSHLQELDENKDKIRFYID